jgi:hypothetical protein
MILQNITRINEYPVRTGGYHGTNDRSQWGMRLDNHINRFTGGMDAKSAIPNGYTHPYCWFMALKPGGASIYKGLAGDGDISYANLAGGKNAECAIGGLGTLDAMGSLIVNAIATILATGELSAEVIGKLEASATLAGTGDIDAALGAIAGAVCEILGSGTADMSIASAIGHASATIYVNQSQASVQQLVEGVWDALATEYNESGTMGQKLNAAGSAGDPWITELPGVYSGTQAGKIIGDINTTIPEAVWDNDDAIFLIACIKNKKSLSKEGATWYLIIRNDSDTNDILKKPLKDKNGNEITDIQAGVLARELASIV